MSLVCPGTKLICRETGDVFFIASINDTVVTYFGKTGAGVCLVSELAGAFHIDDHAGDSIDYDSELNTQHGGNHYKDMGPHQPWLVLREWLTPEEFKGYMKGTAIAYLAREQLKGGLMDIKKAAHTLNAFVELTKQEE